MRLSAYAVAVAGAALLRQSVAAPVEIKGDVAPQVVRREDLSQEDKERLKYFHEPGAGNQMGHYDRRYFKGIVSDEERTETQLHMIRAYLEWFRKKGLDTWIAHGTLLGWWWNGKRLPWDWDLDTQVSDATLNYLGKHYNMTTHKYRSEDGKTERTYLMDVGNMIHERVRGDGMNVIDARWIDVSNGLFIDITGLSETHPDTAPGWWSCKNYHKYQTSDLYPMRETMFEGVAAKVPYAYDKILKDEYKEKALVITEFEEHQWDSQQLLWIKTPEQTEKDRQEAADRAEERKKQEEEEAQRKQEEANTQQEEKKDE
ncbi:hypothetical protein BU23DRAFT_474999 [Bimuria novae-zelandiae CBS 107.79]|uniref:LicD/FKTN/FKRP nucleotidyltransferase domain-containing protein n=1 Tax=Bimuria novae-zelandiae CBS 107.79 TaxID=1447943 RepID=A0A6A5V1L2_9PLEO|nr:hypothetical protein BU23DRAFT_474999 [Bimuria novae-zelandiae CBS 107.79]